MGRPAVDFRVGLDRAGNTTISAIQWRWIRCRATFRAQLGARDALTNDANNAALKAWDRPVPDSTIKEPGGAGLDYAWSDSGLDIEPPCIVSRQDGLQDDLRPTNPQTQERWKQPPSPELVKHIHDQMNAGELMQSILSLE